MTADTGDADPARWSQFSWRRLAELTALAGAVLYAGGWLFFALFFAEFDTTPEAAGVTFQFIVVRTGLMVTVAAIVSILIGAAFPQMFGQLSEPGEWSIANKAFIVLLTLFQAAVVVGLVLLANAWRPWTAFERPFNYVAVGAYILASVVLVILEIGILLVWTGYRAGARKVSIPNFLATALAAAALVIACGATITVGAPSLGQSVRRGSEFSLFGFRVERVSVSWVDPDSMRDTALISECATLIGSSEGRYLLYFRAPDRTLSVSTELVTITRNLTDPCLSKKGAK